ncbi:MULTISPECIES: hypothetical protein [Mesorhizobium]|uniref:hypothetical protein n=1 Tax=Mesorhizobium TaxID=68287 RepID=UPI001485BA30|nr:MULTISPECIES: hypothetical protein [Mesorhizobium]
MTAEKKNNATSEERRKARQAAELRANLLKRKAQARQRKADKSAESTEKKT